MASPGASHGTRGGVSERRNVRRSCVVVNADFIIGCVRLIESVVCGDVYCLQNAFALHSVCLR